MQPAASRVERSLPSILKHHGVEHSHLSMLSPHRHVDFSGTRESSPSPQGSGSLQPLLPVRIAKLIMDITMCLAG